MDSIYERLMKIKIPDQFIIENNEQSLISNLTWLSIFNHIKSEHWHQTSKQTCPHSESLFDHLQTCGRLAYEKAQKENYSEKECVKAYLTGLLHDIGKVGCRKLLSKHTSFKGHGLVGGALIENFYTKELCDEFGLTSDDWADISTCSDVHMCSYFSTQTSILHKFSVNILPESIKRMLYILRYADQLAMTPSLDYNKTADQIKKEVEDNEQEYYSTLFNNINFEDINKKKGILIIIQGGSATGKSTFAKKLINMFGVNKCNHINRDWYMVHWTLKLISEDCNIKLKDITPELYRRCHRLYIDSGKKWAPLMNQDMSRDIFDGLQRGNIVIVDTLATMFDSIETIIPDIATSAYRINFWLHRNNIITEDETINRLGMDLKSQFSAHGETSLYNPFHDRINWSKSISGSESDSENNDWHLQSHLSISIGWTNIKDNILNHLCNEIKTMYDYNQSIPRVPVLEQTMDYSLLELVQILKDMNGIKEFFCQYGYTVSSYVPDAVGIKYIDGINQIWKPKWAREARGRFYYIGDLTKKVIPLKDALQRGIEVLTKAHIDSVITETQDVEIKSLEKLDPTQKHILRTFAGNNDINSFVTGKVDGSLIIVNIYPKESEQYPVIKHLALTYADDFTKSIVNYCINKDLPIVTIATQGTLFISKEMQDYFLTAIQDVINVEIKSVDEWTAVLETFVSKILDYNSKTHLETTCMKNICFEAYCKNRTTISRNLHTELAIGYDHNGFNLLGLMINNYYVPHFDLPKYIFKQPFYYNIKNTLDVYRLMKELDSVVLGNNTMDKFLSNFDMDDLTSTVIHPEGFVLLTFMNGVYDYAKIKTQLYYKCHKVRKTNLQELLLLPEICSNYYPILRNLHIFFDNLHESINVLINRTFNALTNEMKIDSVFYIKQNVKARQRLDLVIDKKLDDNTIKLLEVAYKIMLNNKDNWVDVIALFSPITLEIYKTDSEEIISFTKNLLMKVQPWSSDWETRIKNLFSTYDDAINSLYEIVVGYTI